MSTTPAAIAPVATPPMPWEIIELPFRNTTKAYKRYASGATCVADEEEVAVWAVVEALRAERAALQNQIGEMTIHVAQTGKLPPNPLVGSDSQQVQAPAPDIAEAPPVAKRPRR